MSHLLLPTEGPFVKSSDLKHKPTQLPRQLFYIIRGGTDAVEALELFHELFQESLATSPTTNTDRPGYLSFDAHVGDTACQLRACMLLDVTNVLRGSERHNTIDAIRYTLDTLKQVVAGARRLLAGLLQLDWNKIRAGGLETLGVPKAGLTTDELLTTLRWFETYRGSFRYDSCNASSTDSLLSQDTPSSMQSSLYDFDAGSSDQPTPECGSEVSEINDRKNGLQWNTCNSPQTIRFLVYSYVLSKYKQLASFGDVYRATLKPELAMAMGQKLVQEEFGRQFVRPNKRAMGDEFTSLQRYLSELSCAWLESQTRKLWSLNPQYHSLLRSTIRTSAKGVSSASSYVGYLVLRSLWAENSTPILITTTAFCQSGFHRNYFKVSMHIEDSHDRRELDTSVLPEISWQLKGLTGKDLEGLSRSTEPHIMISGNSIDGTATDYHRRHSSAHIHRDDQCCHNQQHCSDMLASDQDRVVQAVFAEHCHYAFELPRAEGVLGEDRVVQGLMDKHMLGLSALWARSKQEAAELGTGPSYKLYMWQHVALESPARFMARVHGSDRPWISCAV